ncbi:hypothetical protein [Mesorhizobium sp. M0139]|uniref:hypothetical protein n=1 Tax=Mesorhizobium sp. M0139 TaxID=2956892 RepID=UPI003335EEE5
MSTGAEEGLRAAFHPRASIIGNFPGRGRMAECRCLCRRGDGCGLAAEHQP